ncbi:uncharacterized protein TNCV_3073251 [Trichonephila clavipes]|nr:uncharacterized protein TNCV_3073251 [Trichonephila clavipes]
MSPHTITPAVGAVYCCKAKAGMRRSPRDLHTRTRLSSLLRLNLESLLKTTWFHSTAVQFPRARHHSKRRHRRVGVQGSTRNELCNPKCPSARRLRMVREDTGAPSEGATCAWMAADEAADSRRIVKFFQSAPRGHLGWPPLVYTNVIDREWWRTCLSATNDQVFSASERSGERADQGNRRKPSVSRGRLGHNGHFALSC